MTPICIAPTFAKKSGCANRAPTSIASSSITNSSVSIRNGFRKGIAGDRTAMDDPTVISDAVIRVLAMVWFAALFARVRGWEEPRQMGDDLENAVRLLLPDGR